MMGTPTVPRRSLLSALPALTLALFLAPVAAGLIGTWLPAFGYFPALGGESFTLAPWAKLLAQPGLAESLRLTFLSGFLSTLTTFLLTVLLLASCHGARLLLALRGLMALLIPLPHAAGAPGHHLLLPPSVPLVGPCEPLSP